MTDLCPIHHRRWRPHHVVAVAACLAAGACLALVGAPADRVSLEGRSSAHGNNLVLSGGWLLEPLNGRETRMLRRKLARPAPSVDCDELQEPLRLKTLVPAAFCSRCALAKLTATVPQPVDTLTAAVFGIPETDIIHAAASEVCQCSVHHTKCMWCAFALTC